MISMERFDLGSVVLRRPTESDLPGLFRVHSAPQAYQFDPAQRHQTLEWTRDWVAGILQHWEREGFGYWTVLAPRIWWPEAVRPPADPDPIHADRLAIAGMGGIRMFSLDEETVLNVYYRFADYAQGHGLARDLLETAKTWAEQEFPGISLVVRTRPANAAAIHVAQRAGMQIVGNDPVDPDMLVLR